MNLKKNIKNFCRMQKGTGGFTLVELIVVIAILAILSGVAIPAYSGYITRSQKGVDETLALDVVRALQIKSYEYPNMTGVSYVVLTDSGALTEDPMAIEAMEDAFGANWATAVLQYENWEAKYTAAGAGSGAADVAGSTFVTQIGVTKLMQDVQGVALGLSEFLASKWDVDTAKEKLAANLDGVNDNAFSQILTDAKFADGGMTSDALANATVFAVAQYANTNPTAADAFYAPFGTIGNSLDSTSDSLLYDLANWYAANEALVGYLDPEGKSECATLLANVANGTSKTAVLDAAQDMESALATLIGGNSEKMKAYCDYYGIKYDATNNQPAFDTNGAVISTNSNNQAAKDRNAFNQMMKSVHENRGDFATASKLNNSEMITSGDLASSVNSYVSSAQLQGKVDAGDISDATILAVLNGTYTGSAGVIYLIANSNGTVTAAVDMFDAG